MGDRVETPVFEKLVPQAVAVCREGIEAGQSPFAAVIAGPDGQVVCAVHNTVRQTCDATAHAEINAIRQACRALETIDLSGHVMFTTCEPCPMCAAAIHWARLDAVAYGASIEDARAAGFNELGLACEALYEQAGSRVRVYRDVGKADCVALFQQWLTGPNARPY